MDTEVLDISIEKTETVVVPPTEEIKMEECFYQLDREGTRCTKLVPADPHLRRSQFCDDCVLLACGYRVPEKRPTL